MSTTFLAVLLFVVVAVLVILLIGFFAWAVKSGQFQDIEGIKYRMLEDEDEEARRSSVEEQEEERDR